MADFLLKEDGFYLLKEDGSKLLLDEVTPATSAPNAVLNPQNGVGKSNINRYSLLIFINGQLFADLTNIAQERKFSKARNAPDEIDFKVNLDVLEDYARSIGVNSQDILQTGISECRVSRFGVVLSAGILMNWSPELAEDRQIQLNFKGWYELMKYRFTSNAYISPTALSIIQAEVLGTQAKPFGSFGLVFGFVPSPDTTNVYPTKEYKNKSLYDVFSELSKDDLGLDFEFTWDKRINIYHPKQGIQREDIVFSYPGNIKNIKSNNDITKMANYVLARGAGYGNVQLTKFAADTAAQQKYGLFEGVVDHPDIQDDTQLQNLANSELALFKQPVILHEVTLDGSQDPQVGSFNLGDSVRISVSGVLNLYAGINRFFRIDKYSVDIGTEGEETVTVSVS